MIERMRKREIQAAVQQRQNEDMLVQQRQHDDMVSKRRKMQIRKYKRDFGGFEFCDS